jgi:dihydropyrimidine dehydrogenase (NAD+) subunit PreT
MSCARVCPVEVLCVGDCVYNEMGVPPIQIGKLQRFATDRGVRRRLALLRGRARHGQDTSR